MPHLRALYAAYHRDGFEIVGVHTPESAFEQVALDNDYGTRTAWGNRAFPPGIRAYSFTFG